MWLEIQKVNPIWYFDATGSIFKNVRSQKQTLLYSLVTHDTMNKSILPIAEFLTTSHCTSNIRKYLDTIRDMIGINVNDSKLSIAPVVVTDFSWALISAVLDSFNKCNIVEYLKWSFDLVVNKKSQNNYRTHIYICSTHFLKIIIKDIKKLKIKLDNRVKKTFIFSFTLLQNTTSLEEFESHLINIFNIFCQKKTSDCVLISLKKLRESIIRRKLNCIENLLSIDDENKRVNDIFKNKLQFDETFLSKTERNKIKTASPFGWYFENLISKYTFILHQINTSSESFDLENVFFCPELFDIIKKGFICYHYGQVLLLDQYYMNMIKKILEQG